MIADLLEPRDEGEQLARLFRNSAASLPSILIGLPLSKTQAISLGAVYLASGEGAFLLSVALLGKPFVQAVKAEFGVEVLTDASLRSSNAT